MSSNDLVTSRQFSKFFKCSCSVSGTIMRTKMSKRTFENGRCPAEVKCTLNLIVKVSLNGYYGIPSSLVMSTLTDFDINS